MDESYNMVVVDYERAYRDMVRATIETLCDIEFEYITTASQMWEVWYSRTEGLP